MLAGAQNSKKSMKFKHFGVIFNEKVHFLNENVHQAEVSPLGKGGMDTPGSRANWPKLTKFNTAANTAATNKTSQKEGWGGGVARGGWPLFIMFCLMMLLCLLLS